MHLVLKEIFTIKTHQLPIPHWSHNLTILGICDRNSLYGQVYIKFICCNKVTASSAWHIGQRDNILYWYLLCGMDRKWCMAYGIGLPKFNHISQGVQRSLIISCAAVSHGNINKPHPFGLTGTMIQHGTSMQWMNYTL